MDAYCLEVRKLENKFYGLEFHHIVCDNNVSVDVLSKLVLLTLKCQRVSLSMLTVNSCIKVRLDLQADKSPVVVKGPFFPRVVNPRNRIRGTMCSAKIQSSKAR
jgi:hypothetical protein